MGGGAGGRRRGGRTLGQRAWRVIGGVSLALGVIGAVLPVMPTAPFVIVAAYAYNRGAPELAARLERNRAFGPVILDWRENGAIAPRHKILAVAGMTAGFCLGLWLGLPDVVLAGEGAAFVAAGAFVVTRPNGGAARRAAPQDRRGR
ncbi:hypothetical protein BCF33_1749 [Hasllibacter halocynthiae]|uniref:DUF454 domain-containing protein n=1 Tax=Hasllibacter halocynthiae TaxID=595589 RepID=A0A2T0X1Q5_9RHOB|nr:YbaN family protein [Hasllibacter halocynthiae]PRY92886.1 hypothetical protein BCF33_1749 [Hasllibacter halocynthiae]